ncbi:MAG: UvrD-helicase domain-containing protein [Erysipelotrichaceae bacterium]
MDLLTMLNDEQKAAVVADDKYLRIVAGAGSGKTTVLTKRIAYLISHFRVFPFKILAITFTNKAAQEMKERVEKMLSDVDSKPHISTIHSFCVSVLRQNIHYLNYPSSFIILDNYDQKQILKDIYAKLDLSVKEYPYAKVIAYISNNKMAFIDPKKAMTLAGFDYSQKTFALVYEEYLSKTQELKALDFDDLLLFVYRLFKENVEVRAFWQRKYSHILVDEFQDIDEVQYQIIRYLVGGENSLYVVGDPDQTIYTWRGANVDIIMDFEKDYRGCKTVVLNQNYRSSGNILQVANSLIRNNTSRIKKDLLATLPSKDSVICFKGQDEDDEADFVVRNIKKLAKKYGYNNIAVLYRANYLSRFIEKRFIVSNIPYIIYGGLRFFDRAEIKDMLSYLRLIVMEDDLSFKRVINTPKRKIGDKTIEMIEHFAQENNCSMYDAISNVEDFATGANVKKLKEFYELIERFKGKLDSLSIEKLMEHVFVETGYKKMLTEQNEDGKIENVMSLLADINEYESNFEQCSPLEYLQMISLYTDKDSDQNKEQCVKLMTVHAAKGLEFECVFVLEMTEGIFPSERSSNSRKDIEEERRLAYVAFTRAKKRLFITSSLDYSFMLGKSKMISRFIDEIDDGLIEYEGFGVARKVESTNTLNTNVTLKPKAIKKEKIKWKKGMNCCHDAFGIGKIISVDDNFLKIAFDYPYGVKNISKNYGGLTLDNGE